ncbi:MAG: hypothetical protein IJX22_03780, partial [Opitutales bacterium]|nr:hypothetical protein [Opitutales bacterium]
QYRFRRHRQYPRYVCPRRRNGRSGGAQIGFPARAHGRVHLHAEGEEREVRAFVAAVEDEMKSFIRETEKKTGTGTASVSGFSIAG